MAKPNPILRPFGEPWLLYSIIRSVILFLCLFVSAVFFFFFATGSVPGTLSSLYGIVQVILVLIDIILVFVTVLAAAELFHYRPRFVYDPRKPARKRKGRVPPANPGDSWAKLRAELETGAPEGIRAAVIGADGLADDVLKNKGYAGDTFADRLAKLDSASFKTVDRVWSAHRLRNDLVHTPGFEVSLEQGRQALDDYEAFLKELGAL